MIEAARALALVVLVGFAPEAAAQEAPPLMADDEDEPSSRRDDDDDDDDDDHPLDVDDDDDDRGVRRRARPSDDDEPRKKKPSSDARDDGGGASSDRGAQGGEGEVGPSEPTVDAADESPEVAASSTGDDGLCSCACYTCIGTGCAAATVLGTLAMISILSSAQPEEGGEISSDTRARAPATQTVAMRF